MKIKDLIDKHYDKLFEETIKEIGDDLGDLVIEVKIQSEGTTIRRSWKDRDKWLAEEG